MNNRRRLVIVLGTCVSVSGTVFAQSKKPPVIARSMEHLERGCVVSASILLRLFHMLTIRCANFGNRRHLCVQHLIVTTVAMMPVLGSGVTCAQDYPVKVIRIVTSPPGGSNDFVARLLVKGLSEKLGWQLVVDNRATILAPEVVMRTAPDGYTMLVTGGT